MPLSPPVPYEGSWTATMSSALLTVPFASVTLYTTFVVPSFVPLIWAVLPVMSLIVRMDSPPFAPTSSCHEYVFTEALAGATATFAVTVSPMIMCRYLEPNDTSETSPETLNIALLATYLPFSTGPRASTNHMPGLSGTT